MRVDFSMAWHTGAKILNGIVAQLPNIIVTTKDRREVIIPNAVIFTNPVAVGHADTHES